MMRRRVLAALVALAVLTPVVVFSLRWYRDESTRRLLLGSWRTEKNNVREFKDNGTLLWANNNGIVSRTDRWRVKGHQVIYKDDDTNGRPTESRFQIVRLDKRELEFARLVESTVRNNLPLSLIQKRRVVWEPVEGTITWTR